VEGTDVTIRGIFRNVFEGTEENHDVTQASYSPGLYLTSRYTG
jgi:hypothetical protein